MWQKKFQLVMIALLSLGLLGGCNWLNARDNLNKGVQAYSNSNYTDAVDYFSEALRSDPEVPNAELYLALSYAGQFIPNFQTPENEAMAELAIATYQSVLEKDPRSTTAIAGLAAIFQGQDDLEGAREYYLLQAEISPEDPVAHYSVGSIDWNVVGNIAPELVYGPDAALPLTAEQEAMSDEELAAVMAIQRTEIMALIEEGQQSLDRSLELNPDYEDAMTFKNLLYRMSGNMISVDSEDEEEIARQAELFAEADDWFNRSMETRARNAEAAASEFGIVQE
jgi:tetratricopeptide (TPR) repeat protein